MDRSTGDMYSVKMVDRRQVREEFLFRNEISMLMAIQGQTTTALQLSQVLHDDNRMYMFTELMNEGTLEGLIQHRSRQERIDSGLPEAQVKLLVRSLLEGLQALHGLGICHNRIAPEHILLDADGTQVKLCDFGSASYDALPQATSMSAEPKIISSKQLQYTAPELLSQHSTCSHPSLTCDLWSVGVVVYYVLSGQLPFQVETSSSSASSSKSSKRSQIRDKICRAMYDFSGPEWNGVSREAKQFVSALLHLDPQVRLTAPEALQHQWLMAGVAPQQANKTSTYMSSKKENGGRRLWRGHRPRSKNRSGILSRLFVARKG